MKKRDYLEHYKKFEKLNAETGISLQKYCDTRRPKLKYNAVKVAFMRIRKEQEETERGNKIPDNVTRKKPVKDQLNTDRKRSGKTKKPKTEDRVDSNRSVTKKKPVKDTKKKNKKQNDVTELEPLELPEGLKISERHQAFCEKYLSCYNATTAYMEVYGCSYNSAMSNSWKLLRNNGVRQYISYHRGLVRARRQQELDRITERRIQIASTNLNHVARFGEDWLQLIPDDEIAPEHQAAIKRIISKKKLKLVPGTNDQVDQILEVEVGIELKDDTKIMVDLEKSLRDLNSDNSMYSTDYEIQELWERFRDQTREDALSASDLSLELASRGYKVPEPIQVQAKFELGLEGDEAVVGDAEEDLDFDTLDANYEEFQRHHLKEVEEFLPQRRDEIREVYNELGFDPNEKPKGSIINNDVIPDPDPELDDYE